MGSKCLGSIGCCVRFKYHQDAEESNQYAMSRMIDKELEKDKRTFRREVKLLLLGAGESGKSTFLKQMKIIHGQSFEERVLQEYRDVVYVNVVKGMRVLVDARDKLAIEWENPGNALYAEHVFCFENNVPLNEEHFAAYAYSVEKLWSDQSIKTAYDRRHEFQLSDGVRYFFDDLQRIAEVGYTPTTQDVLHARQATKGIAEYNVFINNIPFRFVDVGGQRSQRQKWFQCFDSVTSILFLVSSSEYDQVLLEDRTTNRLTESLGIFENIANSRCFLEVSMILFLNKTDILKEKLNKLRKMQIAAQNHEHSVTSNGSPTSAAHPQEKTALSKPITIKDYFPDFEGEPLKLEHVQNFMIKKFDAQRQERRKPMYHHFTTATDTENIKYVFNAVRNTILQKNITSLMLQ